MSPTAATRAHRAGGQAGFSLVEMLLATALLLVIVVSVVPLFTRSLESNATGSRASFMTVFVQQDLERVNQATVDHPYWDFGGPLTSATMSGNALDFGTEYWTSAAADRIGDEGWRSDASGAGLYLWERSAKLRKYTYADVLPGSLEVTGSGLASLGHPELFDSPLADDDGVAGRNVHILEMRVTIQPHSGLPLDRGQQMTVGQFRAY
jgi:prepilin-type N-terminal cleavage/methylation domain-containing protein